jgi:hypothetical protein
VVTCFCSATLAAAGTRLVGAAAAADDERKPAQPTNPTKAESGAEGASAHDDAKDAKPPADTRPTTNAADLLTGQLDRVLPEVSFNGAAFGDVLDFFRDVSGANIVADWKGLESAGVDRKTLISYKAKNVRFRAALREILVLAGDAKHPITDAAGGGVLLVSNQARARWFEGERTARDTRDVGVLARVMPEVRFDGVAFAEVIEFLRDVSGATINVHSKELEAAGVDRNTPVTIRLQNVRFGEALRLVLLTASAGDKPPEFTTDEGRILIRAFAATSAADPPAAFVPKPEKKPDGSGKPATPGGR